MAREGPATHGVRPPLPDPELNEEASKETSSSASTSSSSASSQPSGGPTSIRHQPCTAFGSVCWLNMIPTNGGDLSQEAAGGGTAVHVVDPESAEEANKAVSAMGHASQRSGGPPGQGGPPPDPRAVEEAAAGNVVQENRDGGLIGGSSDPNNWLVRGIRKVMSVMKWVLNDFRMRHLIWIKLIFLFQSASMTVLYPYLNLHMKSLGLTVMEVAVINAVVPVLFIFTPPLASFLSGSGNHFRTTLAALTALGGLGALLLLAVPVGRDTRPFPTHLKWGISCGRPNNQARFQKLMLHGFRKDQCHLNDDAIPNLDNITFTPGTCGYLCPTRANLLDQQGLQEASTWKPRFLEYKVIWPNRGGGFGISEIVDVVTLDSPEAREYHEPDLMDNNIFFPMNWTFYLSCDRIRPQDCIFSPITRAPPADSDYRVRLARVSSPFRSTEVGPSFDVLSITPPDSLVPVATPINCGAKEMLAQVVSAIDPGSLRGLESSGGPQQQQETPEFLTETDVAEDKGGTAGDPVPDVARFPACRLHCLVNVERSLMCNNTHAGVIHDPSLTFWTYLVIRSGLGLFTAASLMMFEGAVMATVQEMGGDYGIQRFVGNFGAIVLAPIGGYAIDAASSASLDGGGGLPDFSPVVYIYLALKLVAAVMILLLIRMDFRPPGDQMLFLSNVRQVAANLEVVAFLAMMMLAGTFWGYIETFLFWYLDDMGASRFLMGWTVAVGMLTSLPFLVFSGPITDAVGHMNVIVIGMLAYFARMLGYSFVEDPVYIYPFEALEGLTMALMMTSAVTYVASISTPATIASVMGMMGALFFGVGKASGSLVGGALMDGYGARATFRALAAVAIICAVMYSLFECFYVKPLKEKVRLTLADASGLSGGQQSSKDSNGNNHLSSSSNGSSSNGAKVSSGMEPAMAGEDVPDGGYTTSTTGTKPTSNLSGLGLSSVRIGIGPPTLARSGPSNNSSNGRTNQVHQLTSSSPSPLPSTPSQSVSTMSMEDAINEAPSASAAPHPQSTGPRSITGGTRV